MITTSRLVCLLALVCASCARATTPSVPENGNFEIAGEDWQSPAAGWTRGGYWGTEVPPNDVRREAELGGAFLRVISGLSFEKGTVLATLRQPVVLEPETKSVTVGFRSRLTGLQTGAERWQCARVELNFTDQEGKPIKAYPAVTIAASTDWKTTEQNLKIPVGAKSVIIKAGFWSSMGTLDIDDLQLTFVK